MGKKTILNINNELLVFITVIYYTSKLLWDSLIPYAFTLGFFGISMLLAFFYIYLYRISISEVLIFLFFFVFAFYVICNGFYQDQLSQFYRAIYEYIIYAFPFFLVLFCLPFTNIYRLSERIVKWGVFIGILSWVEYFSKSYISHVPKSGNGILYGGNHAFRAVVFSRSELAHGMILGFFAVIAFSLFLRKQSLKRLMCTFFLFASILTTSSRGPLVSAAGAIVIMYILYVALIENNPQKKIMATLILLIVMILGIFILLSDFQTGNETINYFLLRLRNIINWNSDAGNVGRLSRWNWALSLFRRNPIFGIGPSKTGSWGAGSMGVTESGVLKRLCELGIVGFVLHYMFIFITIIMSLRKVAYLDNGHNVSMIMFLGLLSLVLINDCILQSTEEPAVCFIMWFALAGMIYLHDLDGLKSFDYGM